MKKVETLIIGGGASGLFCALALCRNDLLVLERKDRVGKKLSATGNGQGNVSNLNLSVDKYFSLHGDDGKIEKILTKYGYDQTIGFLQSKGALFTADERGRVYPAGRQASAVTDLMRYCLESEGKQVITDCQVTSVVNRKGEYEVTANTAQGKQSFVAKNLVIACGGKASPSMGTDGSAYELVKSLGHSVTPTYPSLVQLKTDTTHIKGLKGVRLFATVTAVKKGKPIASESGDLIFTDYGVSGDSIFRLSAFIAHEKDDITLEIDLLPAVSESGLKEILNRRNEQKIFGGNELLCGLLPNALGRAVIKKAGGKNANEIAKLVKKFTLSTRGTLGFDYAQVTKGGVPLDEVDDDLQSKKARNLFITGEMLDVDGQCGGYNLQWAFSTALAVATKINNQ